MFRIPWSVNDQNHLRQFSEHLHATSDSQVTFFCSYLPDEGESLGADFITSLLSHYRRHFASQWNDRLQSSRIVIMTNLVYSHSVIGLRSKVTTVARQLRIENTFCWRRWSFDGVRVRLLKSIIVNVDLYFLWKRLKLKHYERVPFNVFVSWGSCQNGPKKR